MVFIWTLNLFSHVLCLRSQKVLRVVLWLRYFLNDFEEWILTRRTVTILNPVPQTVATLQIQMTQTCWLGHWKGFVNSNWRDWKDFNSRLGRSSVKVKYSYEDFKDSGCREDSLWRSFVHSLPFLIKSLTHAMPVNSNVGLKQKSALKKAVGFYVFMLLGKKNSTPFVDAMM